MLGGAVVKMMWYGIVCMVRITGFARKFEVLYG